MFSGIVEGLTEVLKIEENGSNTVFTFANVFKEPIYIDQRISHNGVCLTVTSFDKDKYTVVAIQETLIKSNLGELGVGDKVNIELAVTAHTRMDGHVVQGHVDCTGKVLAVNDLNGSWEFQIEFPEEHEALVIPQGSITLNGISLTVAAINKNQIKVAIIPYTYENTNLKTLNPGDKINVEFDVFGKYVINYLRQSGR